MAIKTRQCVLFPSGWFIPIGSVPESFRNLPSQFSNSCELYSLVCLLNNNRRWSRNPLLRTTLSVCHPIVLFVCDKLQPTRQLTSFAILFLITASFTREKLAVLRDATFTLSKRFPIRFWAIHVLELVYDEDRNYAFVREKRQHLPTFAGFHLSRFGVSLFRLPVQSHACNEAAGERAAVLVQRFSEKAPNHPPTNFSATPEFQCRKKLRSAPF